MIGLPALRLRGVNLAVVTLGFAAAMDALIFSSVGFAGGTAGLPIKSPHLLGLNLAANAGRSTNRPIFGVMVLVVVILIGLLVARLRRGPAGRMLLAIRSNERAAGSVGINVAQGKLMAFALAAFIAGIGGALTGYAQGELTADSFAAFTSISLLAIVFVAGVGRIAGAVVAGVMFSAAGLFVTFLDIHLSVGKYQAIVAGIALVLTAVQNPDGLTSTSTGKGPAVALMKLRDRVLGLRKPERGRSATAVIEDGDTTAGHRSGARQARRPSPGCLTFDPASPAAAEPPARRAPRRRVRDRHDAAAAVVVAPGRGARGSSRIGSGPTTAGTAVGSQSADSVLVEYARAPLRSGERVTWQVKVWTDAGESDWSDPDVFELGLLDPGDWSARWIAPVEPELPPAGEPAGDARARRVRAPGRARSPARGCTRPRTGSTRRS